MPDPFELRPITRRRLLRYGGAAATGLAAADPLLRAASAFARPVRRGGRGPDSLPNPSVPAGTVDEALPFDHIVIVMMENHSFDNLLGALHLSGQPAAHGLKLNSKGAARNWNPNAAGERVYSFPFATTAQGTGVGQDWNATHTQIDGGKMDGFARYNGSTQPMGYWSEDRLPFAYSFARTFTLANKWFCSAPCQTYPNRRFLMAGTAYGNISTDFESIFSSPPPPNGTIFDRLHAYGVEWKNYFTDLPSTGIIRSTVEKYPSNIRPYAEFLVDCKAGTLPAVSLVDPEFGVLGEAGGPLSKLPGLEALGAKIGETGGDQENPQNMAYGEYWAYQTVKAVLESPAWPRTLLVYTYDEHGGYYDHVPPPAAIAPDSIAPELKPGDVPGGYNIYGPRVPAVVASPYSKPNAVTNVVHDHTSVLATIEKKWNLPALTYRDANANTVEDFLSLGEASFPEPPKAIVEPPVPTEALVGS